MTKAFYELFKKVEGDDVVKSTDFLMSNKSDASGVFEFDTIPESYVGFLRRDVGEGWTVLRSAVSILEIYAMFKGTRCVCGQYKRTTMSHCGECYHALPPEKRQALYNRFRQGYEQAFMDSLIFLIDAGRTDADRIRAAVPTK